MADAVGADLARIYQADIAPAIPARHRGAALPFGTFHPCEALKRAGTPIEVAEAVAYLATARYVTRQNVVVDDYTQAIRGMHKMIITHLSAGVHVIPSSPSA